jgi:hypothetical protein
LHISEVRNFGRYSFDLYQKNLVAMIISIAIYSVRDVFFTFGKSGIFTSSHHWTAGALLHSASVKGPAKFQGMDGSKRLQ